MGLVGMIASLINFTGDDYSWLVEMIRILINSLITTTGWYDHGLDQECDAYACKASGCRHEKRGEFQDHLSTECRRTHAVHVCRKLARWHTSLNHGLDQLYGIKCGLEAGEVELARSRPREQAIPMYLVRMSDYPPHLHHGQYPSNAKLKIETSSNHSVLYCTTLSPWMRMVEVLRIFKRETSSAQQNQG